MLENHQKISEILLKTTSRNICPLGKETYTNNFSIRIIPESLLPDYRTVDRFIESSVQGKNMTVEDAVYAVFMFFKDTYNPQYIEVSSHVTDANHAEVTVIKHAWHLD